MTVCIAAISAPQLPNVIPHVIALTDTMLTAGEEIEYEPNQSKIYIFNNNVVGLIAGDAADQIAICNRANARLIDRAQYAVEQVAVEFSRQLLAHKRKKAEVAYLAPFGLSMKKFIGGQNAMDSSLAASLHQGILDYRVECDTIVCGHDATGQHIYVIDESGQISCNDSVGFAAIGLGGGHAESHFMFSQYTPRGWPAPEALLLAYTAKKRAEAAPSVGRKTYLAVMNPNSPVWIMDDSQPLLRTLEAQYDDVQKKSKAIELRGYRAVRTALRTLEKQVGQQVQPKTPRGGRNPESQPKQPAPAKRRRRRK